MSEESDAEELREQDETIERLRSEVKRLKRDAKKLTADLGGVQPFLAAAESWWASKRPLDWTIEEHIRNPWVNCVGPVERHLALMVCELERKNTHAR